MALNCVKRELRGSALVATIENGPLNVIDRSVREGLQAAVLEARSLIDEGRIDRLVITGAGKTFVAGADVKEFDCDPVEPHLPDVLKILAELPAVAAINGTALGGGLEIALACRLRIATPRAVMGLPETRLGIVPGAGGTQRLPRLVGVAKAARLIAEGKTVTGSQAVEIGLVDSLAEEVVVAALALEATAFERPSTDLRPAPAPAEAEIAELRQDAERRLRGQDAPLEALSLVAASSTTPLDEALAAERATFLRLRQGEKARALRHIFFAERAALSPKQKFAAEPKELQRALVVGGGTMGVSIAFALSCAGLHVTLLENDLSAQVRAEGRISDLFGGAVARGKLSPSEAEQRRTSGFSFIAGYAPLPSVDIAIEAVFEDLEVKRRIFRRLARDLPPGTILATNTSYLDPNQIAEGITRPERFLGLHFFAPAHVMKLVEIIRADKTSEATLATAFALTRRLDKIAVQSGVCDGFIGNRILRRSRQTANRLLLEGARPVDVDSALRDFGLAMGVFEAQDLSGLDIAYANRRPASGGLPMVADLLVERLGRLGRKTGAGWYDYVEGKPVTSGAVSTLIAEAAAEAGIVVEETHSARTIQRRLMIAQIGEAFDILDEGIAREAADIDLVMVHGYGFPRWRGGLMCLAKEWGLAESWRQRAHQIP